MKAFLKGSDNSVFSLSPKVTTLGREGCDIQLQTSGVDQQHAVIEYHEQEDCYVLQDLNTAQGTYVNDCRVQNAIVRLAPGDIVKVGYSGVPFELNIENPPPARQERPAGFQQIAYPPVQQRPAWSQPLTLLSDTMNYVPTDTQPSINQGAMNLPYLSTGPATITIPSAVWTPTNQPVPRPPVSLRARPLSAGSARPVSAGSAASSARRVNGGFDRVQTFTSPVQSPVTSQRSVVSGGWTNGLDRRATPPVSVPVMGSPDNFRLQEKEQRIIALTEEVSRLRNLEVDTLRKDQMLQQMQQQILELQHRVATQGPLIMGADTDLSQRVVALETELTSKNQEMISMKEQFRTIQLSNAQLERSSSPPVMTDELSLKLKELNNVKNELERVKKDKGITSGLVTQMQRDLSSKDSTISKLTREIEMLKKELREKEGYVSTMTAKVNKMKDTGKSTEERDAREKELISLRQKFKATENKIQEHQDLISKLKEELEKTKLSVFEEKQIQKKTQIQMDQTKAELVDVQRTERVVRVDLEQATKRLERFRNRVIQVTYSTPGIKAPETEIGDDELIETLKKIVDERTSFFQKVKDLEIQLKSTDSAQDSFKKTSSDLRNKLNNIITHLKTNGFNATSLKQELDLLNSVVTSDSLVWVRDSLVDLLKSALSWEQAIEASLEQCGVNVKLSNDEPGKHILLLFAKWESSISEKERLMAQITQVEQQYKEELTRNRTVAEEDSENRVRDAIEKTRLEGEEKLNRALEEVRAVEEEKLDNAVREERQRVEQLEMSLEQLQETFTNQQGDVRSQAEETSQMMERLEEYSTLEQSLREQIVSLETQVTEFKENLSQEGQKWDRKYEQDIQSYKEQNKQHGVTICAMEERLVKMTKRAREYQDEVSTYKKTIHELRGEVTALKSKPVPKPVPPPKPKVIVQKPSEDFVAMENLIIILRKESTELKSKIQDQEDVVLGLRRDLAGAHARLSDITGELSETQKRENEKNKELLIQRERELTDVRQQLAKLSKIIDKQKDELKSLESSLSKEKSFSQKYKSNLTENMDKIRALETALELEKEEQKNQLSLLDQEGRITSEMTALGAQCRGERHEQVIMRQREALAELRSRIKSLEVSKPPLPTQDHALQQVIMLKKELAEMRANQALSEDKVALGTLDREVSRARGLLGNANPEADMERSAHRETMDALDSSENTYLTLLRAVASCLDLDSVDGLRPIGHIPRDERERLIMERENACQLVANRIKVLKERVSRKDELLHGYERDLVKMRQSQELAERKATQVENLVSDVKTKAEETQYLRESLNRTRDRLDQEKRLNTAIKQRKTFHLENERAHIPSTRPGSYSSHKCSNIDIMGKNVAKKRQQKDMVKRKNYEIHTLKSELVDKEKSLCDSEYRLATLENSMGLERQAEFVES
ncbi:LOW QUALITY PROTEIN: forkhead-associated domain-containing protein 1-like [Pecten maximus]|uniref:LOW QUALITY PROTEIN: forkhead-associated domain-containing protein 1-like n=1 Tax=Pecten maximus TaxID=6579 RepID=UPI001458AA2A|nr:LOW QUALITY PROTEIN: forkhead-associated domain-containing protein 1-like [Pecten maximus]